MTEDIVLPDKLPSSAAGDLIRLLGRPRAGTITLDARRVRAIGARAAEILVRFKAATEAAGGDVILKPCAAFEEDLGILGVCGHLIDKEAS